jgi:hypothetical protein
VRDGCTRDHRRKRLPDLVEDVEEQLQVNGRWTYKRSNLYDESAVPAVVENITAEEQVKHAA